MGLLLEPLGLSWGLLGGLGGSIWTPLGPFGAPFGALVPFWAPFGAQFAPLWVLYGFFVYLNGFRTLFLQQVRGIPRQMLDLAKQFS